jgi:hypothetical protein
MAKQQTRLGTHLHPQVFFQDEPATISMRIHLAEREKWKHIITRPAFINYAKSDSGYVVQFEDHRKDCEYLCHFSLKKLRKEHFEGTCSWLLAEFAQELGVSAEALLVEALIHAQGMQ